MKNKRETGGGEWDRRLPGRVRNISKRRDRGILPRAKFASRNIDHQTFKLIPVLLQLYSVIDFLSKEEVWDREAPNS